MKRFYGIAEWAVLFAIACGGPLAGQTAAEFEAASIRESSGQGHRSEQGGPETKSPTLYRYSHASLLDLICVAWHVESFQVSSAKALDKKEFDLSARVPEAASKE